MDKSLAQRLKTYIENHPFDSGDSDYETVLDQLYQEYAESHESDPPEIGEGFKELEDFLCALPLDEITRYLTSAAAFAPPMSIKLSWTVSNTAHTYWLSCSRKKLNDGFERIQMCLYLPVK